MKIDQSFVQSLPGDLTGAAIIQAIIVMARTLHLGVVAEGVETREQMEFLRSHQCQEMQGYCLSRPKTLEELTPLLADDMFFKMSFSADGASQDPCGAG